jgi:7-cyano-7-deazaguanine synthase
MTGSKAVVLLSGGLDSATVLAIALERGHQIKALSFSYGQRHSLELVAASRTALSMGVHDHVIIDLDPAPFASSALTGGGDVPDSGSLSGIGKAIPATYVPARNTVFLSYALAVAESMMADHIYTGVNSLDYSGYPDCRPEYLDAFRKLASLATARAVNGCPPSVHAPLINMTKARIIARGLSLGVDYSITLSCYRPSPSGAGCGKCDSCRLRLEGFRKNGVSDPAPYEKSDG